MLNIDNDELLSREQVLALPYYCHGRKPGRGTAYSTLFRHTKHGRLMPNGERRKLKSFRLASGTFYRRQDVDEFFAALNGIEGELPTPLDIAHTGADAALSELADAGLC